MAQTAIVNKAPSSEACLPAPRNKTKPDRKSTRLNSSHGYISYAVFCLKKKKTRLSSSGFYARMMRNYRTHIGTFFFQFSCPIYHVATSTCYCTEIGYDVQILVVMMNQ